MLFPVTGAKQPNYLVTADDVETYLAIEVQPLDNRKRKVLFLFFPFYFLPPPPPPNKKDIYVGMEWVLIMVFYLIYNSTYF